MGSNKKYEINGFSLEPIRNRYETRVIALLRETLAEAAKFCGCRMCIEDVYAAAMSGLPGHYAQKGTIVLKSELQDSDLRARLLEAIEKVRANPNHVIPSKTHRLTNYS